MKLNLDELDADGAPALHVVLVSERRDLARILLAHGADVDATNEDGETALYWGVVRGQLKNVEFLLRRGADPHAASPLSRLSAYNRALRTNDPRIIAAFDAHFGRQRAAMSTHTSTTSSGSFGLRQTLTKILAFWLNYNGPTSPLGPERSYARL